MKKIVFLRINPNAVGGAERYLRRLTKALKDVGMDTSIRSYLCLLYTSSAIVAFAKDLGIKTIAEYVHSKEIFEICKEIGVDEFQGFYFGAPERRCV